MDRPADMASSAIMNNPAGIRMMLRSIRWRLPLSYAAIALLATLALGATMLPALRDYYAQRELEYLMGYATFTSMRVARMLENGEPVAAIQAQLDGVSFLTQAHIKVFDPQRQVVVDTGAPDQREVVVAYAPMAESRLWSIALPQNPSQYTSFMWVRSRSDVSDSCPGYPGLCSAAAARDIAPPDYFDQRSGGHEGPGFRGDVLFAAAPFGAGVYAEGADAARRSDQRVETPIEGRDGKLLGYLTVSDGLAYGSAILDRVTQGWAAAGLIAVTVAAIAGWFVSRSMSAPLLALASVTGRMARGDLSARVSVNSRDEIGTLARSFNEMASQVENTVTTLRRFVGDAAHELHTPITALNANLELAASETDEARRLTFIERAREQLMRLETLTTDLLDLSRFESDRGADERTLVSLSRLVEETSEVYASRAEQKGIAFLYESPDHEVVARVNEGQFRRVVGNLLDNAIKFTPEEGSVSIGLASRDNRIEVWVKDTGIGIPSDDLPYLFGRFHRGRNAAAFPGSGLGLAIIKAIVEAHRGDVSVESGGQGTRFAIRLPAAG